MTTAMHYDTIMLGKYCIMLNLNLRSVYKHFKPVHYKINILNSCPTQGRVDGWDAMKPLYYRSVSNKGAGRPRLTHHHKGRWNETKWMRWVWRNGGMKCVVGENGRNPEKNLPRSRFVHHETHMEWPRRELATPAVGGERLTACATRPPCSLYQPKLCPFQLTNNRNKKLMWSSFLRKSRLKINNFIAELEN